MRVVRLPKVRSVDVEVVRAGPAVAPVRPPAEALTCVWRVLRPGPPVWSERALVIPALRLEKPALGMSGCILDDSRLSGVRTSHDSRGAASDRSGKSSGDGGDGMRSSGASTCPMLCSGDDTTSRGNSPNTKANTMRTMRATKTNRR